MKKILCLIILLSAIYFVNAQDLIISFQPKISGTPIDSILAINLTTSQGVKLLGGESLVLVKKTTNINVLHDNLEKGAIYPNPTDVDAIFSFSTNKSEQVEIRLFNANGQILNQKRQNLVPGNHRFELKFPDTGIYFVTILKSNGYNGFKVVYTGRAKQNSSVSYMGSGNLNSQKPGTNQLKSATKDKTLTYAEGDFIQYQVSSGVNTTIITETPTVSKTLDVKFVRCIDNDNKSYKVVKIGDLWWMAENLAYLPVVYPPSDFSTYDNPGSRYYVYNYYGTNVTEAKNNASYTKYGVLYNWQAAQKACPPDWHLPSHDEWIALTALLGLGNVAGAKLKESGYSHWFSPNTGSTNEVGFTALPAGSSFQGGFMSEGYLGYWWSSTEYNSYEAYSQGLSYNSIVFFDRENDKKEYGFSVRCVRNSETSYLKEPPVSDFTASKTNITEGETILFTNESDNSPTSSLWNFGDNTTSTEKSPKHTYSAAGTYTVSLQTTNSFGTNTKTVSNYITVTAPGRSRTRSFVYQGRTYETVIINGKEWMAENLAYLPAVYPCLGSKNEYSKTEPRYYIYGYEGYDVAAARNTANYATYGVLYNWPAALAACPPGWHLPSDAEWTDLTNFLGGASVAGGKLKESGHSHWFNYYYYNNSTNEFGFTALPAGVYYTVGNENIGRSGFWWSSTEVSTGAAWNRVLNDVSYEDLIRLAEPKESGLSVRCVKD